MDIEVTDIIHKVADTVSPEYDGEAFELSKLEKVRRNRESRLEILQHQTCNRRGHTEDLFEKNKDCRRISYGIIGQTVFHRAFGLLGTY